MTFPGMPCEWGSIDVMDVSGELELDVDHDLFRKRLSADGKPLDDGNKHEVSNVKHLLAITGCHITTRAIRCGLISLRVLALPASAMFMCIAGRQQWCQQIAHSIMCVCRWGRSRRRSRWRRATAQRTAALAMAPSRRSTSAATPVTRCARAPVCLCKGASRSALNIVQARCSHSMAITACSKQLAGQGCNLRNCAAYIHVPVQVREAYRRRGWGFNNPQGIAQCEKEGFLTKIQVRWIGMSVVNLHGSCWLAVGRRWLPCTY